VQKVAFGIGSYCHVRISGQWDKRWSRQTQLPKKGQRAPSKGHCPIVRTGREPSQNRPLVKYCTLIVDAFKEGRAALRQCLTTPEVLCIGFTLEPYRNVLGIAFYAGLPARYIRPDALQSRVTSRPTATISPGPEGRGIYELIKTAINNS